MAISGKVQAAIVATGAAILAGAVAVFGFPPAKAPPADTPPPSTIAAPPAVSGDDAPAQPSSAPSEKPLALQQSVSGASPASVSPTSAPATPAPPPAAPAPVTVPAAPEQAQAGPRFDIVRVEPTGDSVIAGQMTPGGTLELLVNGQVYDRAEAQDSGAFALTPPSLPPGDHELTLREVGRDGAVTASRQSVTVVIADDRRSPPVVALTEPDRPTLVLAGPGIDVPDSTTAPVTQVADAQVADGQVADAQAAASVRSTEAQPAQSEPVQSESAEVRSAEGLPDEAAAPGAREEGDAATAPAVSVTTVEAEAGRLYVSGNAPAGASVRLYLNDSYLAAGKAAPDGRLAFSIGSGLGDGDYRVRLDEVAPGGDEVLSRAEVPFLMDNARLAENADLPETGDGPAAAPGAEPGDGAHVVVPEVRTTRVERGDSLWRISRRVYGSGRRYTVIYGANQEQIRNPHRIYPGQLFVLPADPENPVAHQ